MSSPAEDTVVDRKLLPHTFGPWFGRFHGLTDVQQRAIPAVMRGGHVLITSATASGKTEAYAAPAAERVLASEKADGCRLIVVSPTRALANDLKRRLETPMDLIGLKLGRYTGEHKERRGGKLPQVTITTLEALDSLLARRPESLAGLVSVVVDEVHVVDNTPRGDQLRVLLERLDAVANRPQRIAVSATVDRPEEVAARYLRDAELVVVPGARRILGRFFEGLGAPAMGKHLDQLADAGFKKVLVFCQTRNQVELYGTQLPRKTRFAEHVFAHHGSLAKGQRERTERLFHGAPAAVCFATLTLEMGIDIGTVDYVLLAGPPSDVSSLLQRIGRGGRRDDTNRAGFAVRNEAQRHVVATMARLGKQGELCAAPYGFRNSVLVQQALVMASARGWVERSDLEACLPPDVREDLGKDGVRDLLDALEDQELLERSGGRLVPSEAIEARYVRGTLHSNIEDTPGVDVVDRITGDVIGSITRLEASTIRLGGGEREIVGEFGGRVLTDRGREGKRAFFRSAGSPTVSMTQARAVVEALEATGFKVPPNTIVQLPSPRGTVLLHGLGTVGVLYLTSILSRVREPGGRAPAWDLLGSSPYLMHLARPLEEFPRPVEGDLEAFSVERRTKLLPLTAPGPWSTSLPEELRLAGARRGLGLDRVHGFLEGVRFVDLERGVPELEGVWEDL